MKMYEELASWWPLLSPPADYEEEAACYARVIAEAAEQPVRTVLELGSGGGNNASLLKQRFTMTLVEPSAAMRAVSRGLNPDCEHIDGDMRSVRLAREFDAVFVHDAVHSELEPGSHEVFVATKPTSNRRSLQSEQEQKQQQ